jgi:hypothetical protein
MSSNAGVIEDEEERTMRIAMGIQKGLSLGLVEGSRAILYEFSAATANATTSPSSAATVKSNSSGNSHTVQNTATNAVTHSNVVRSAPTSVSAQKSRNNNNAADDDDDASVKSGDSRVSGTSMLSTNTKIKKKRKTIINTMWETMSTVSFCRIFFTDIVCCRLQCLLCIHQMSKLNEDHADKDEDGVASSSAAPATPSRPRMTKYTVVNATVSGDNPILRWDPSNNSLTMTTNDGGLNTVEEEGESILGLLSAQSIGALVGANNGVPNNPVNVNGEMIAAADLCNRLASIQQLKNKSFNERHAVIIRSAPYNKQLLSVFADVSDADNDG